MLSVRIIFLTCPDNDYPAMLHTLRHRLRRTCLHVFHARKIWLERQPDEIYFLHLFFCDLQKAHSRVEARPRIAEKAKLSLVRSCLANAEGEDGGISRCVYLQRRATQAACQTAGGIRGGERKLHGTGAMNDEGCLDRNNATLCHTLVVGKMEQHLVRIENGGIDLAAWRYDQLKRGIDCGERLLLRGLLRHLVEVILGHVGRIGDHQFAPIRHRKGSHLCVANAHHGLAVNKLHAGVGLCCHIKGSRAQFFQLRPILPDIRIGFLRIDLAARKGQQGKDEKQSFHSVVNPLNSSLMITFENHRVRMMQPSPHGLLPGCNSMCLFTQTIRSF